MKTPYYAVIFTSIKKSDTTGYSEMALAMQKLAAKQPGFLGFESASGTPNISVSYWESLTSIEQWKVQAQHAVAQNLGKKQWYQYYKVRICEVKHEYDFGTF